MGNKSFFDIFIRVFFFFFDVEYKSHQKVVYFFPTKKKMMFARSKIQEMRKSFLIYKKHECCWMMWGMYQISNQSPFKLELSSAHRTVCIYSCEQIMMMMWNNEDEIHVERKNECIVLRYFGLYFFEWKDETKTKTCNKWKRNECELLRLISVFDC